jgi:hypothetical protein
VFTASMRFDLGEDVEALQEMVHRWAQERVRPMAARIDRLSRRAVARDGRAGPSGHHRRGGVRRRRHGLFGACDRGGGDRPRLGLGQPELRGAFESLRQPDPAQRQRRTAREVPAEAGLGRACRRAGDVGGGCGVGRGRHEAARREEERPLRAERHEILDHQRPRRRYSWSSMPRPTPRPARRGSPPS